jgi:hypothetical protein
VNNRHYTPGLIAEWTTSALLEPSLGASPTSLDHGTLPRMSKALVKRSGGGGGGSGVVPAVCSALIPGVGQLVNGETDKAIGVFAVAVVSGASLLGAIPIIGGIAGLVYGATWLYGVADGYIQGKKK